MRDKLLAGRTYWSRMPQAKRRLTAISGFVVITGLIGSIIVQSQAATYVVSMEAETGSRTGNYKTVDSPTASGSKFVSFGTAGTTPTPTPTPPAPTPTPPAPTPTPPAPTPPAPATPVNKSIYLAPATGSYAVGANFTVDIRVNSSDAINAVGATLGYSTNLEFVSIDAAGTAFGVDASSTGGSGVVNIERGNTAAVTGDNLVAKVTFKVKSAGAGAVDVKETSVALAVSDNKDVITVRRDGAYTLR